MPMDPVKFRNLYKAGQRRVAHAKRERKKKLKEYNARHFQQLELQLVRLPDQAKWLETELNTNKRA